MEITCTCDKTASSMNVCLEHYTHGSTRGHQIFVDNKPTNLDDLFVDEMEIVSMQPSYPHCGKGFSRKDNVIHHMRSTCPNMKKNEFEPEEQSEHRMEMSAKRQREKIDIPQHKVLCPECNEEMPQSCHRAHLRTNRHKANA
ncbi:hypothetical protein FQA39_LY10956 [Lamprigera yunnana]|nr:hypothetical protein FQA39_LY10956 [Lamprigera yunnana]